MELVGCNKEDDIEEGCASDEEVTDFFRSKDPRLYVIVGEQFVDFSNIDQPLSTLMSMLTQAPLPVSPFVYG